jgi:galactose-6-phosphate isomerase
MPLLDMTDVLLDPDFLDTTPVCTRQTQVDDGHGRVRNETVTLPFAGVVSMDAGAIIRRLPEGSYITGSIMIYTLFRLRLRGENVDADLVDWHGARYRVSNMGDYTGYGAGFVWAICEPLVPAG